MEVIKQLSLAFIFIFLTSDVAESVVVTVNDGQLRGLFLNLSTGLGSYYSFRGIPYAEPPVGQLRFKDPLPIKPWDGVKLALIHQPVCIQFNELLNTYLPGSEDCLFLNVYTPDLKPTEPLPVIFFIHGGAFRSGSGDVVVYGPDFIVQKNVVLVTCNYRLDALGFLKLDTKEVPGNAGLKDQRMALKWVHDNIHHFGGDPGEVTIMGQSAGSASVTYHMMSPMSKGLFKRAIAISGVPFSEWALTYKLKERSFALGKLLGNDTDDPEKMLDFLQSLPAVRVINQFPIVIPEEKSWHHGFKMTAFQPAPEEDFGQERFLVESPINTLKLNNIAPVDLLIGYTSMESLIVMREILSTDMLQEYNNKRELLLIPREILLFGKCPADNTTLSNKIHQQYFGDKPIDTKTIDRFVDYNSDVVFVYNINRFIKHLPSGQKKFVYKFFSISDRNRFTPQGIPYNVTGVAHADDLEYLFDSRVPSGGYPVDTSSREYKLIDQTVTLFTNFAKHGNPTPDDTLGVVWPEYSNDNKNYLMINDTLTVANDVDAYVNDFWEKIYNDGCAELV